MRIRLEPMTKALARRFYQEFELDMDLFADPGKYRPYIYDQQQCDATVERYRKLGRTHKAIMLDDKPIGELVLKNVDHAQQHCTLGITLIHDVYKNKGYGTHAEILALKFAFEELHMETVFADSLIRNTRSRHVLTKVGFTEIGRDATFVYYRCDRTSWKLSE